MDLHYWISARVFLASSLPAKLVGELIAAVNAVRALCLSPAFRDAKPRWYWTTGWSGSLAALSLSKSAAR